MSDTGLLSAPLKSSGSIRVITLNLWGQNGAWADRRSVLINGLRKRNPLRSFSWDVSQRIDYILVRCGPHGPTLKVASCTRIFDEPTNGVWGSDHFGVVADLEIPFDVA